MVVRNERISREVREYAVTLSLVIISGASRSRSSSASPACADGAPNEAAEAGEAETRAAQGRRQ